MEKQKIETNEYYQQGAVIKGCAGLIKVTDLTHSFLLSFTSPTLGQCKRKWAGIALF